MLTIGYSVRRGSTVRPLPDSSRLQVLIAQPDEALCKSLCAVLVFGSRRASGRGNTKGNRQSCEGVTPSTPDGCWRCYATADLRR